MNEHGYRTIWYDTRKKEMHLWTWDDQGERIKVVEPFNPYLYIETTTKSDAVSIYNTNLKKITFPSQFERRRYVKDCGIKRLFFNHKAEQQFLIEKYLGLNETFEFSEKPLKVCTLDIEVYSPHEFPAAEHAKHPINLLTFYDSLDDRFHTFGLGPYTPKADNVSYYHCKSEYDLLERFLVLWESDYPDVVTGWNSDGFDIPYIINRITKMMSENDAKRLSPVRSLYLKQSFVQKFGQAQDKWVIYGLNCIDYKEVYETFTREKREAYNLEYISSVELGEGKTKINATSLASLSKTDWDKYVDYNIQDVNLLNKLEDKLRYVKTMRIISHKGFCNIIDTLGKVMVVSGAISAQSLKRGQVLSTFEHDDMGNYSGGFVKEIEPGLQEAVITFDANSLYPNTIITLNLSPETKIGKVVAHDKENDEIELILVNGKRHKLSAANFIAFLEKEGVALSKARIMFSQKTKGIVPEYVDGLYSERVRNQEEASKIEKSLVHCKDGSDMHIKNTKKMEQLDILQYTLKILLNSIYGVFANRFGPLYDIDCASSITETGQAVIKQANHILDKYAETEYGIDHPIAHYNDTDSTHISIKPILDVLDEPLCDDKGVIRRNVYTLANSINKHLNSEITKWSEEVLNSNDARFYFKREGICPTGLYQSKKHYILHLKDKGSDEPMPCDIIKPVGVELVRSTMSEEVKTLLRNVVKELLYTRDREKTVEVFRDSYEKFKILPPEQVAFRSGIKTYDKYAKMAKGFAKASRTPVAVAGALYHNNLLKEYGLESSYEKLASDMRVKWVYCNSNNKYSIANIAFLDKMPKEFVDIETDYDKMFMKIIEPAIERLFECAHWKMVNMRAEYTVDLLDFFKE